MCHWKVTLHETLKSLFYLSVCVKLVCVCLGAVWYICRMSSSMELYKCSLPAAAKQHAAEYLHEEEERRDSEICQILDWLQTQPNLNARRGLYQIYP
jgi:hypothetical protein